ncbi:MAG TPA: hypothetical protein VG105_02830 [Paraburkholderia sp.]|jgi:hypothetical protein|nr:hypothetical protein [Paraburkholderia sp.]
MKPALVKRILLTLCGIAATGVGYRALVAATQTPVAIAAINVQHRNDVRGRPVADHRQASLPAARTTTDAATDATPHAMAHAAAHAPAPASHGAAASATPATPRERLAALRAPLSVESANNPFAASSWLPPPPPVEAPVVQEVRAPAPVAPPVPFTYLGELDAKAARPQVFLSSGDRLLIVSPGEVVDDQYRVESVSESDVVLTYLPLNQTQAVSIPRDEGK